jgi:H/ACA ribonucleoprotein complex subunit 2
MAKDRESSKPSHAQPEKEEKKKKKRSEEEGVHKSSDKKDKKEKKAKREALAERALNEIQSASAAAEAKSDDDEAGETTAVEVDATSKEMLRPVGALVPFANPLADEKVAKKVFKSVKKGTQHSSLSLL